MMGRPSKGASSRDEGDWTCPQCGNVNFAFRETCNMRRCGAPKPAVRPPAPGSMYMAPVAGEAFVAEPLYGQQYPYTPMARDSYTITPHMPAGMMPMHGVPMGVGPPLPPPPPGYRPPPPMAFDPRVTAVDPRMRYAPPTPFMDASMQFQYGSYGRPMVRHLAELNDDYRKRKAGSAVSSGGDWICPKCGNTNFAFRESCNMRKCGAPKPAEEELAQALAQSRKTPRTAEETEPPAGSWTCKLCGNKNWPFRQKCNRRNCGADRDQSEDKSRPPVGDAAPGVAGAPPASPVPGIYATGAAVMSAVPPSPAGPATGHASLALVPPPAALAAGPPTALVGLSGHGVAPGMAQTQAPAPVMMMPMAPLPPPTNMPPTTDAGWQNMHAVA